MRIKYADKMLSEFEKIQSVYNVSKDFKKLEKELKNLLHKYHNNYGLINYYLLFAEECFEKNDILRITDQIRAAFVNRCVAGLIGKWCFQIDNTKICLLKIRQYLRKNIATHFGVWFGKSSEIDIARK